MESGSSKCVKGYDVEMICLFYLPYFQSPGEHLEESKYPLYCNVHESFLAESFSAQRFRGQPLPRREIWLAIWKEPRGHLCVLLNFCKLYRTAGMN